MSTHIGKFYNFHCERFLTTTKLKHSCKIRDVEGAVPYDDTQSSFRFNRHPYGDAQSSFFDLITTPTAMLSRLLDLITTPTATLNRLLDLITPRRYSIFLKTMCKK